METPHLCQNVRASGHSVIHREPVFAELASIIRSTLGGANYSLNS